MDKLNRALFPFSVKAEDYGHGCNYVVTFDNVKDVIGGAETIEDAIEDAFNNLSVWLDYCIENNIEIEQYKSRNEDEFSGRVTLRMPQKLHKDISDFANKDGISLNYVINDAIRFYLTYKSLDEVKKMVTKKPEKIIANNDLTQKSKKITL